MGVRNPKLLSNLLSESGRLLAPDLIRDEETRRQVAFLSDVQGALEEWDAETRDCEDDFSDEVGRLMDNAWGDEPTPAQPPGLRPRSQTKPVLRPETPLEGDWQLDLAAALDRIETAPVTPEQRKILSRDPGQADVNAQLRQGPILPQNDRGTRILKRGDAKGAILEFSKAIRSDPQHPQPWTKRGIAKARSGDLQGAIDDYSEAIAQDAEYLPALANRAAAYFHVEDFEATEQDCTDAIEFAPKLAKAWLFRGIARAKLGWGAGAQDDLLKFLGLSPYSPYRSLIRRTLKECTDWDEDDEDE